MIHFVCSFLKCNEISNHNMNKLPSNINFRIYK
jgi:hypothetical protein